MEIKVKYYLFLLLFVISCNESSKNKINHCSQNSISDRWNVGMNDTILCQKKNDVYLVYSFQGDSIYNIIWGNKYISNTTSRKYEVLGNGVMGFVDNNENVMLLQQGCGTFCQCYMFLPLKQNAIEKVYYNALAYDLENNLVAFISKQNDSIIMVENYISGQKTEIKESNLCPAIYKGACIDTIYFKEKNLFIKWQGNNWESDKSDTQEKKILISI
jgi:hypothetical protein